VRKLKIIEHISLDGVIQAPGSPTEDGDYPHGGWTAPHRDPAVRGTILAEHAKSFDLLLGRHTYDICAGFWPKAPSNPLADSLEWGPVESLGQDIVEGVRHIKAKSGPDLILWGSSTLTPMLLEHGLADEILLFVYPVLLGKGKRFFSDGTAPCELALTSTKAASSGVIISTYTPAGPLRIGPS
jgi:dihydrofolate reductase